MTTRTINDCVQAFAQEIQAAGKRQNAQQDVDFLVDDMTYAATRSVEDYKDTWRSRRRWRAVSGSLVELYYDADADKFYWDLFSTDDQVSVDFPNYVDETYTDAEFLFDDEGNEKEWTSYLNLTFSELLDPEEDE